MRQKPERHRDAAERTVKDIRRKTRKRYSSKDKIRSVRAGLPGEGSIADCAARKVLPRASITVGRRGLWNQVANAWPATQLGKPTPEKCRICDIVWCSATVPVGPFR